MPNNESKENVDLSRPAVEVKIPQVKLRLQDLAFLRSLAEPNSVHCRVPSSVEDRLRFLDLIAMTNMPPSEKIVAEVEAEKIKLVKSLAAATEKEDWNQAGNDVYALKNLVSRLRPRPVDVLTEKGKVLLRDGEVRIRARKVGCVG